MGNFLFLCLMFFLPTFVVNREDTFARCEKHSSKLDISRSLISIFHLCQIARHAHSVKVYSKKKQSIITKQRIEVPYIHFMLLRHKSTKF